MLDYIDGQTLADLLQRSDPWLLNERNAVRMFKELIEVVDYLHRHNITHCDIKPDNIMITSNNKNLVLIDLDKCYTDSLNDTSGDPSIYGLSEKERGNINIDFHGIGKIAESLKKYVQGFKLRRYKEFVKECHKPNVSSVKLLELLGSTPSKIRGFSKSLLFIVPMLILILSLLMLLKVSRHETKQMEYISDDSISNIELQPDDAEQEFILYRPQQKNEFAENISGIQSNTQQQIYDEAQKMAAQLDIRIKPLYEKLNRGLDNLEKLRQNHNFSGQQLLDSLRKHTIKEEEYIKETYAILDETFPHLTEREFWRVLGFSKVYTGYKRRATPQEAALGKEIEMRQKNDSVDLAQ